MVVVGADAAGMSGASQARRLRPDPADLQIVVVERQDWTSYSAGGIPYWIAGDVASPDDLVARTPQQHRDRDIDLRLRTECTGIDLAAGRIEVRNADGLSYLPFDTLAVATGATPVRPDVPGIGCALGVQTLDDGQRVLDRLESLRPGAAGHAVVVGGGDVGVEMAEAMVRRGLSVLLIDRAPQPMRTTLDPEMGRLVRDAMTGLGIEMRSGETVVGVDTDAAGNARQVTTDQGCYDAEIVVLGLGVRPNTELAVAAGLPVGGHGGLLTDDRQRAADGVWAAGDCTEVVDRVSGALLHVPLGTHANKQGRVAGSDIGGGALRFPGVVGTAISKVCDLEIARTGLGEASAAQAGFDVVSRVVESTSRAGYFPGAAPLTLKVIADRGTRRLLGLQIVGRDGSGKRIDTAATALWNEMTNDEVAMLDLAYAPPFSPVWDPVQIACRSLADRH
jgi:NADPH-dependent 2,4-dienoyl-CoA reductase/sulfur reductase-like enzyme